MTFQNRKIKLFLFAMIFAVILVSSNSTTFAQKKLPRFEDYPVTKIYRGKVAPLKLTDWDEAWRERFQLAIENFEVDFAGYYIIYTWPCGSECLAGVAINAKNGRVSWWDVRLNPPVEKPVDYKVGSSLIILSGCRGGNPDAKTGIHYYRIRNGRFVHLRSVPSKQHPDCS